MKLNVSCEPMMQDSKGNYQLLTTELTSELRLHMADYIAVLRWQSLDTDPRTIKMLNDANSLGLLSNADASLAAPLDMECDAVNESLKYNVINRPRLHGDLPSIEEVKKRREQYDNFVKAEKDKRKIREANHLQREIQRANQIVADEAVCIDADFMVQLEEDQTIQYMPRNTLEQMRAFSAGTYQLAHAQNTYDVQRSS